MGLFRRNDPLASRAKRLKARLADVESQIEQLGQAGDQAAAPPAAGHELKPGDEPLPPRPRCRGEELHDADSAEERNRDRQQPHQPVAALHLHITTTVLG